MWMQIDHSPKQVRSDPFRVLSIDGGGMRGIYTAAYLAWLSDRFARERNLETLDIGKGFDLVTGTSTGAIIACAAASGILMSKVVELYRMHGPKIFTPRLPDGIAQAVPQLYSRSSSLAYANEVMRRALHSMLADRTLGDLYRERGIAMSIPAVEMGQWRAWVFRDSTPWKPPRRSLQARRCVPSVERGADLPIAGGGRCGGCARRPLCVC